MKSVVLLLSLVLIRVEGVRHLNANGPFRKHHIVDDEPSPYACDRGEGSSLSKVSTVEYINVSTTTYSSNKQIDITWTPISTPCVDDFIGIYFVDIDHLRACDYFDYEFVQGSESSTTWQMTNLRRSLEFRYG